MAKSSLSLPYNVLDLQNAEFFDFIDRFCGKDILEYLQLLSIRSTRTLLQIDDVFSPLQQNFMELDNVKQKLAFCRSDGVCVIKIGIQHDMDILLKSLQNASFSNEQASTTSTDEKNLYLTSEVCRQYPFLKRLIEYFTTSSQSSRSTEKPFLDHFLENLLSNLSVVKSRYRYEEPVIDFALCSFILAGRNAYEFLRINMPGALPNLTTIQTKLAKEGFRALEGEFRFTDLKKHMNVVHSKYVFCAEDCTSVQRKVVYDVRSNSFVGFTSPLDGNGMPVLTHFQTNSFEDLKYWFEEQDISQLLNLHMAQPICTGYQNIHAIALAAYGTNGKFNLLNIIHRWFTLLEEASREGIRILGYSTDADPRYLSAMRFVSGFFNTLLNNPMLNHPLSMKIVIPKSWTWFFLEGHQVVLCMQDAIHICTKLRNRLLSSSSFMLMGNYSINIHYLLQVIQSISKFSHNLVKSDVIPRDKQNYRSCEKICSALDCLKEINGSDATVIYVKIIHCVIIAFIHTSTTTSNRIYYAWLSVFLSRIWRTWLDLTPKKKLNYFVSQMNHLSEPTRLKFEEKKNQGTKKNFFMTSPSFVCLELNAHHLTYLALLVAENQLPTETLKIYLFNSQTCEHFFRLTRSMSGTFSQRANFSVQEYLNRQEKISVLHSIKSKTNSKSTTVKIQFPNHHKTQHDQQKPMNEPEKISKQQIEEEVHRAFKDALDLVAPLGILQDLKKENIVTLDQISKHIRCYFQNSSRKIDFLNPTKDDEEMVQSDSDSDESDTHDGDQDATDLYDSENDEDDCAVSSISNTSSRSLQMMKGVRDSINPDLKDSFFLVNIDGRKKYLHKNTAIWYLTDEKYKLSSDRLSRVMEN